MPPAGTVLSVDRRELSFGFFGGLHRCGQLLTQAVDGLAVRSTLAESSAGEELGAPGRAALAALRGRAGIWCARPGQSVSYGAPRPPATRFPGLSEAIVGRKADSQT